MDIAFKPEIQEEDDPELQQIPFYLREKVAAIIEQKVEAKVQAEMKVFKDEVLRELEDQRMQNQMHISHYLEHPYHKGYHPAKFHPHYYNYGYPYGYPGAIKPSNSKSPVRGEPLYKVPSVSASVDLQQLPKAVKNFTIKPESPRKSKLSSKQPKVPQEKWDGYTTSHTTQGVDTERKKVLERRNEYAQQMRSQASPRRGKKTTQS